MDVTLDREADGRLLVKVQSDEWEVNVRASQADLMRLKDIRSADWNARRSIRAGETAGSHVFWACAGEVVTLAIGHDDETWDVAVNVPVELVEQMVLQAERL